MCIFKTTYPIALFAACLLHINLSLADTETHSPNDSAGTITFVYDLGEGECTVQAIPQKFQISHYAGGPGEIRPCTNRKVRYIKLNNVRSAATIRLWSYMDGSKPAGCDPNETFNFHIEFRTIKNATSTSMIAFDTMQPYKENEVIQPGLRLIKKNITDYNNTNRNLSCVEVLYN